MIVIGERELERYLREFGENVAADYAALPTLPGPGFRWRLVLECEYSASKTTVRHQWVAEPCEVKK